MIEVYPIIRVDDWIKREFVSGTKEKTPWLQNPADPKQFAMFKETIGESTGEAWSEKIASEIGPIIGIQTHSADIGQYSGQYGSLVWKMMDEDEERLEEGGDIIPGFEEYRDYDRDNLVCKKGFYCFQMLYDVLNHYDFLEELFDMIIYDALIGNTDRHQDNFGFLLINKNKKRKFAPLYDNASSLGRELPEERMNQCLQNEQQFEAYINRADTYIRWGWSTKRKTKHFRLIQELLNEYPIYVLNSIQKVKLLTDERIENIISEVPDLIMSDIQKAFVSKVLVRRRNKLMSYL